MQERLLKENASLSNAVKKLNRDVSKVVFFVFAVHDSYLISLRRFSYQEFGFSELFSS